MSDDELRKALIDLLEALDRLETSIYSARYHIRRALERWSRRSSSSASG